jgi:hypothetical protein
VRVEEFTGYWLGRPNIRDHWENLGVDGRIILRWILGRYGSMRRIGFGWLRIGSVEGFCEHCNEPSVSIRKQYSFDKLSDSFSNNILHHGVSK